MVVTITNLGYGDFTPSYWISRSIIAFMSVFGIFQTALIVGVLRTVFFIFSVDEPFSSHMIWPISISTFWNEKFAKVKLWLFLQMKKESWGWWKETVLIKFVGMLLLDWFKLHGRNIVSKRNKLWIFMMMMILIIHSGGFYTCFHERFEFSFLLKKVRNPESVWNIKKVFNDKYRVSFQFCMLIPRT